MTDPSSPLEHIYRQSVEALRSYRTGPEEQRTKRLKEAARLSVDAREHFFTKDGDVDWIGRTYAYRQWIRQVAIDAGYPGEEVATVLAAVRYHVGDALRLRIGSENVKSLGLSDTTGRERAIGKRERSSRILHLVQQGPDNVTDVVELLQLFSASLGRVDAALFRQAPAEVLASIADEIAATRTRLTQIAVLTR